MTARVPGEVPGSHRRLRLSRNREGTMPCGEQNLDTDQEPSWQAQAILGVRGLGCSNILVNSCPNCTLYYLHYLHLHIHIFHSMWLLRVSLAH